MFILHVGRTMAALSVMTNPPYLTGDSGSSQPSGGEFTGSMVCSVGWVSVSQPEML